MFDILFHFLINYLWQDTTFLLKNFFNESFFFFLIFLIGFFVFLEITSVLIGSTKVLSQETNDKIMIIDMIRNIPIIISLHK